MPAEQISNQEKEALLFESRKRLIDEGIDNMPEVTLNPFYHTDGTSVQNFYQENDVADISLGSVFVEYPNGSKQSVPDHELTHSAIDKNNTYVIETGRMSKAFKEDDSISTKDLSKRIVITKIYSEIVTSYRGHTRGGGEAHEESKNRDKKIENVRKIPVLVEKLTDQLNLERVDGLEKPNYRELSRADAVGYFLGRMLALSDQTLDTKGLVFMDPEEMYAVVQQIEPYLDEKTDTEIGNMLAEGIISVPTYRENRRQWWQKGLLKHLPIRR